MSFSAVKIKALMPLGILILLVAFYAWNNITWSTLDSVPPYNDSAHHLANYRTVLHSLDGSLDAEQQTHYKKEFLYAPVYYYFAALASLFFGDTDLIHIPVNLLFYAILLVAVYASGQKLFGAREGITACLILSLYPYIYGSTRIFSVDSALCSMAALCVCFLLYSEELRRTRYTVAAAVVCLLGMLTKQSFLIYVAGPLAFMLGRAVARREASRKVLLLICIGVALPMILSLTPGTAILFKNHFKDATFYSPGDPLVRTFYYLLILPGQINMLSALVFLTSLTSFAFKKTENRTVVLIWLLTPFIILMCAPLKDSKYSLPLLPVIALISSWGFYSILKKPVPRYALLSVVLAFGVFMHFALLRDIRFPQNPLIGKSLRAGLKPYMEYAHTPRGKHLDKVQKELFRLLKSHIVPGKIRNVGVTGYDVYPNGLINPSNSRFTDNFIIVNEWGIKNLVLRHKLPLIVHQLKKIPVESVPQEISKLDLFITALPLAEFFPRAVPFFDLIKTFEVPSDGSRIYLYLKNRSRLDKVQGELFKALQSAIAAGGTPHIGLVEYSVSSKGFVNPTEFLLTDHFIVVNEQTIKNYILQHRLPWVVHILARPLDFYAPEGIGKLDLLIMGFSMEEFYPQASRFFDRVATLDVPSDGSKIYIYLKNKTRGRSAVFESQWVRETSTDGRLEKAQEAFRKGRYDPSIKWLREFLEGKEAAGHLQAVAYVGLASNYVELMVRDTVTSKDYFSKAEQYFHKALKVMGASDPLWPSVYSGLGYLYLSQGSYEQALSYLDQGLAYYPREGSLKEHGDLLTNVGYCYLGKKDPAKAREYFTQAIAVFSEADYETLKGALTGLELCTPDLSARKANP